MALPDQTGDVVHGPRDSLGTGLGAGLVPSRLAHRSGGSAPDADVAEVIDHAIERLATLRRLSNPAHGPTQLHLLTTLIDEADQRLPDAIVLAHDQDLDWTDIARLAGLTLRETILLADPDPEHELDP